MELETLNKLCSAELREAIEVNIERKVDSVALDKKLVEAATVATQVKYLQRAATKLPSYYAARCVLPPLSFEQASSERVAAVKSLHGVSLLDLTCGLGVDSFHFSKSFERVVALERDEVLAATARENFSRMGVTNIEVVCATAEEYLRECDEKFDWVYADPDRRSATGQKLVRLEECSPNILSIMEDVQRVAGGRFMIKNSPLFDVDEAFRLFSPVRVEVVSLADECKEVLISTCTEDLLVATAVGRGSIEASRGAVEQSFCSKEFDTKAYNYLVIPDVALQKSRMVSHALRHEVELWSNNGFGFAVQRPQSPLCRSFAIERIEEYHPKRLRAELGGERVELLKRDFPLTAQQIIKQLKIKEGGTRRVAFTSINGCRLTIFLE
ncbi:MAG: methyltransferase domain-containing protein [Rikenellaceae bacterium]